MNAEFLSLVEKVNKFVQSSKSCKIDKNLSIDIFKYFSFTKIIWFLDINNSWSVRLAFELEGDKYCEISNVLADCSCKTQVEYVRDTENLFYFQEEKDSRCSLTIVFGGLGFSNSAIFFEYDQKKSVAEIQQIIMIFNLLFLFFSQADKIFDHDESDNLNLAIELYSRAKVIDSFLDLGILLFKKKMSSFVFLNNGIEKLLDKDRNYLYSYPEKFYDYILQEDRKRFKDFIVAVKDEAVDDFRFVTSKGLIKHCRVEISLFDKRKNEEIYILLIKDTSSEKDLIVQNSRLHKKLELVIDSLREILIFIDKDGYFREVYVPEMNYSYINSEDFLNKSYKDVIVSKEDYLFLKKQIDSAIKHRRKVNFIYHFNFDKQTRVFDVTVVPKFSEQREFLGVMVSLFDINLFKDLKKINKASNIADPKGHHCLFSNRRSRELFRENQYLWYFIEVEAMFFSGIGTEIKNSLNSLMGYAQILEQKFSDKEALEKLSRIKNESRQVANLINLISELKILRTEKIIPLRDKIDVDSFVKSIDEYLRFILEPLPMNYRFEVGDNLPMILFSNKELLTKAAYSFIDYSFYYVKFSSEFRLNVGVEFILDRRYLVFKVFGLNRQFSETELYYIFNFTEESVSSLTGYDDDLLILVLINKLVLFVGGLFLIESDENLSNFSLALPI
ncbi:MAG: hypothetical protein JXR63_02080 [Spirochaetales bacterium]|nr:hypothetical protein [Spirochaetales bacterium]